MSDPLSIFIGVLLVALCAALVTFQIVSLVMAAR